MTFDSIIGQESAIGEIRNYIALGRMSGTFLFSGPEGVGKRLTALTTAKAVNCGDADLNACGKCVTCRKIEHRSHPDVHIIDTLSTDDTEYPYAVFGAPENVLPGTSKKTDHGGSDIKISHIRSLQRDINLKPYEGKMKVFIINDAHRMSRDASDAFLKTLEESTTRNLVILITAKPALLSRTILSRCRVIKFHALRREEIKRMLGEDKLLDEETIHFLSYFSEGRLGSAVRMKERKDIIARKNGIIDGYTAAGSRRAGVSFSKGAGESREELVEALNILAAWYRDIYVFKSGMPESELINRDRKNDLIRLVNEYSFAELDEKLKCISDSLFFIERNVNIKLLFLNIRMELWKN